MLHIPADLRYAVRSLRRAPLFAAVSVLSIAFGIAANTAVFTLLDQVVLRTLPVTRPGELVQLHSKGTESFGGAMGDGTELSYAMYRDLRDQNSVFAAMFCRMQTSLHVGHAGRTEQVAGELVSGNFFAELGVQPALGRLLTPDDDRTPGGHPVAVLGFNHWQSRFGGEPGIVGRTITVNGQPLEVIGIVQAGFDGLDIGQPAQVYVPIMMQPKMGPAWLQLEGRRFRWVQVYARLAPGVTPETARAGIQPLYRSLLQQEAKDAAFEQASGDTRRRFLEGALTVDDASRGHSGLQQSLSEPLKILMAIAVGLLLVVCANVANLLIARGAARHRELALRLAVGAGPGHIARLLLAESLVLAVVGAIAGLVLANWGAGVLLAYFVTADTPLAVTADADVRILLFTSGLALVTAVLGGVLPAFRSGRMDVVSSLKGSGGAVVSEQPRLRKTLVVAQVALSFILLMGAGLFVRSLKNLTDVDPGFRTSRMLTFGFDLSRSGYDGPRAEAFMKTFLDRLSGTPGVAGTAFTFQSLLGGGGWGMGFTVEGYQPPPGDDAGSRVNGVSPGFFKTMGIPLLAGREFDLRDDRASALPEGWPYTKAVVSETFAKWYFKGVNPLGRRIGIGTNPGTTMPIEVVGVAKDTRYAAIREDPFPAVFLPYLQGTMENITAYVKTDRDPYTVMQAIRRELAALDSQVALFGVSTLDERVDRSIVNERLIASLSSTLATMATLLSIVGLYGVMAYTVTRRTREFGIRMALGALDRQIAAGVLREAVILVAAGLVLGFVGAWWLERAAVWSLGEYVRKQLYGVLPSETFNIVSAAVVLATVSVLAALLPARRAANVTPMSALREE